MCELCFIIGFFVCQSRIIFADIPLFVQSRKYTKTLYNKNFGNWGWKDGKLRSESGGIQNVF